MNVPACDFGGLVEEVITAPVPNIGAVVVGG